VIGGNMRLRAAKELGWEELPVRVVSVPPEVEAQWNLKDNNQWGDYVDEEVAEILQGLDASGVDIGVLGFTSDEVERLLALVGIGADADDEGFDPTPPAQATSRPGDLFVLGPHLLVCGDARDATTWEVLFAPPRIESAEAMWTDPPYGVDLRVRTAEHRMDPDKSRRVGLEPAFEGDRPEDLAPLLSAVFPHIDAHLAPGSPWYIAGPHGRMARVFEEEIERVGWYHAQTLVWVKNSFVPGRADYHYQHEAVFYGWKRGAAHRWLAAPDQPTVVDDEAQVSRMKREELVALIKQLRNARLTDVIREDKTQHNDLHPTMKPTGLIRHMLANSTRRGDVVLDPFAGSGSTMVACELMGRRAALIELEPRFCDVIVRRWQELDPGHRAERLRSGQIQPLGPIS
jgi:DNA modification methylase